MKFFLIQGPVAFERFLRFADVIKLRPVFQKDRYKNLKVFWYIKKVKIFKKQN